MWCSGQPGWLIYTALGAGWLTCSRGQGVRETEAGFSEAWKGAGKLLCPLPLVGFSCLIQARLG